MPGSPSRRRAGRFSRLGRIDWQAEADMAALAPIASKIAKLIPRLASDHEGEVIATVRAIARTLEATGRDFHDLADAIGREPKRVIIYRNWGPGDPETWHELAMWLRDHDGGQLKPHERAFVRDMAGRLVMGGKPTDKQAAWLRSLHGRFRREGAA